MNFQTYVKTVLSRSVPLPDAEQRMHAQLGMLTEAGELGDLFKRQVAYGQAYDPVKLLNECGDIFWYFVLYMDCSSLHMKVVDDWLAKIQAGPWTDTGESNEKVCRLLALALTALAADEVAEMTRSDWAEACKAALGLLFGLLRRHGYTVEQCLDANDAKLEARHGPAFSQGGVSRDTRDHAAEAAAVQTHGQAQANQAAG